VAAGVMNGKMANLKLAHAIVAAVRAAEGAIGATPTARVIPSSLCGE